MTQIKNPFMESYLMKTLLELGFIIIKKKDIYSLFLFIASLMILNRNKHLQEYLDIQLGLY